MQSSAAATAFVVVMLVALIGLHVEALGSGPKMGAVITLGAGLLGWIVGLVRAWVGVQ